MAPSIGHRMLKTNGIRLHLAEAGLEGGPLVVVLHGFPEFWYGWRHQIPVLAQAGYHVVAPDQRGYNLSDKPIGLAAYNLDVLVADIIGLIDHFEEEQALLVGHDWGAAVAWHLANKHPARLKKMAILNVPHPTVMRQTLLCSWSQRRKSWYMAYFQLPWLPEFSLRIGECRNALRALNATSLPGSFAQEDLTRYIEAWKQPGAWTGMLNWYRAILRRPPKPLPSPMIEVPTLLIWGKQDAALNWEMAESSRQLCREGHLELLDDATHWVQHDEPERVNQLLLDFLGSG